MPDMLQWTNKAKWTCVRVVISWLLTLIIVVGSYVLFGYVQWVESQLLSKNEFGIDCGIIYPSEDFIQYNSTLSSQSYNSYTQCYCESNYFSLNVT